MLDIKITRTTHPKQKPDENNLGFGKKFTDHMFVMDYTEGEGWHDARIVPYGSFELDPATVVFHYAQEIFEGMKAYRTADDTVQLFRPDCNAKRFQDSADRLCIPKIPVEDYIQAVETLVDVDRDWVPHTDGASLYIRPFIFANDVGLGVHASKHYIFCIICAPSGAYYAEGINLLKDWGYEVVEGKLAIADIMQAAREGKLEEVFGTGTAAVVSPVKELVWKGEHAYIGDGKIGPVTQKLYDTMTGMQWGKIPDTKGWIVPVEKKN